MDQAIAHGREVVADGALEGTASDDLVDAVLEASRALVAVAARSLVNLAEDVTLPQYRVLVELAVRGPQRVADLAGVLRVDPSTGTRMCDRLVRKGLVSRRRAHADRRTVRVSLAHAGRELLMEVSQRRRAELAEILGRLPAADREPTVKVLRAFAAAAGELREQDWSLGWRLDTTHKGAPDIPQPGPQPLPTDRTRPTERTRKREHHK